MKKILIVILLIFTFFSCKTKEIISEKVVTVKDSTEVVNLKQQFSESEIARFDLSVQLKESRKEIERLQSNISYSVREYDTDKPNVPLRKETLYNQATTSENNVVVDMERETLLKREITSLKSERIELNKTVSLLEKEKIDLHSQLETKSGLQWKLVGIIGLLLLWIFRKAIGRLIGIR